jgi:hypothetical protein
MRDAMFVLEELVGVMAVRYCRNYTHLYCEEGNTPFQRVLWAIWGLHEGGAPRDEVEYCINQLWKINGMNPTNFGEMQDFVFGGLHAEQH